MVEPERQRQLHQYRRAGGFLCDSHSRRGLGSRRIGYAFDRLLLYATGGAAFAGITVHDASPAVGMFDDHSITRTGWTVGAGVDYAFTDNLIGRVEYRYADFGSFGYTSNVFPGFNENHEISENVVRGGLAWKF